MCGIAGIIYKNKAKKNTEKFKRAANLSKHRGPDDTGYYGNDSLDMVHHRLSILDLDERSNQPFSLAGNSSVLVYNGEIYNYRELADKYNLDLKTTSDTEVLYDLLNRSDFRLWELNGIFGFALYDENTKKLLLARDRLGVKPLYYYEDSDCFIFSSEAKVIYAYLDQLEINFQVLSEFLNYGSSISNETIINGVNKLPAGSSLTLNLSDFTSTTKQYWSIQNDILHQQARPKYEDALTTTRTLLENAVERQCISDVEVGAYLSGGIDSSAVVGFASKYTDKKLNTYSVDFDKNPNSELSLARKVAKKFNTNHHEFQVTTEHIDDFLEDLIFQYDEPFTDPAMIPLHLIAEKAAASSKVVLQGDGGDEVFAGYGKHLDLRQFHYRRLAFKTLAGFHPKKDQRIHFSNRFDDLDFKDTGLLMATISRQKATIDETKLFKTQIAEKLSEADPFKEYRLKNAAFEKLPLMQRMLYTDMEIVLPQIFLEKVDKVNMWHSIEARVPFLDNELVEYVLKLPQEYKLKKGITKSFLREILKGEIPDEILNDRKKSFGTPISEWLRTTLYDYALAFFEKGKKLGFPMDYALAEKLLHEHKNKDTGNSSLLWRILVLTIWLSFYHQKIADFQLS